MKKLIDALWKDYEENTVLINDLEIGSQEYKTLLDERDKIRNELIKGEQVLEDKTAKEEQLKSENLNEKKRNFINIVTFTISTLLSLYAINRTFKFDQEATVTSTLGRGILNGVIPKIFKRWLIFIYKETK